MNALGRKPVLLCALIVPAVALLLQCRQSEGRADSGPPPIEIKATVHPAQAMTVAAQIDGQVERIAVREGMAINTEEPIVELSNPAVERDAAVARAQIEWIDEQLRRRATGTANHPGRGRDSLEITEQILELKRRRFETMKRLRKTNDVTTREMEQAEIEYLTALRDYNERRFSAGGSSSVGDSELLRIEREKSAAQERFAARRQSLLRIASPISGVVTRLHVTPGQAVFPRDAIADVADASTLHVRGNVAPELLRYIRPGMSVEVKVLSVPLRTFADEIEYVIPVSGAGSQSRAATVVVVIPNPDGSLQPNTEALITLRSLR